MTMQGALRRVATLCGSEIAEPVRSAARFAGCFRLCSVPTLPKWLRHAVRIPQDR
jgi:hypothetical protein